MSAIIAGTSTKLIATYNTSSSPQSTSKGPSVNHDRPVQSGARTDAPVALDALAYAIRDDSLIVRCLNQRRPERHLPLPVHKPHAVAGGAWLRGLATARRSLARGDRRRQDDRTLQLPYKP